MDVLWCQDTQDIGLSNSKLRSALKCIVWSQCTPVPDRRTDGRTNIMAIARRFVLTNASRAKKQQNSVYGNKMTCTRRNWSWKRDRCKFNRQTCDYEASAKNNNLGREQQKMDTEKVLMNKSDISQRWENCCTDLYKQQLDQRTSDEVIKELKHIITTGTRAQLPPSKRAMRSCWY